ncbi:MAG: hypothetical protein HYR72_14895 [Deltaproteobacteria bacterium]|nr:hypothetical protein [Deltaproteobacteria bacterium]
MILCIYGRSSAPFTEPTARALHAAVEDLGGTLHPITLERAVAEHAQDPAHWADVRRVYVLPFDVPSRLPADAPAAPAALIRWLMPRAEVFNSFDVHEICWDKPKLTEHWLQRGVRAPASLMTTSIEDATAFVQHHEWTILKATHTGGGHGDYVVTVAADGLVAEARGQRYELELVPAGAPPRIRDRQLLYPAPFFFQRLVADVGARGVLTPGQLLRAYIVDGQLLFWTESYREHYRSASDWIVATGSGAKYRFLFGVGEEPRKLAMRAAEAVSLRIGVVDIVRTASDGAYALSAHTDGHHLAIDREYKRLPEFRDAFDIDRFIAEALLTEPEPIKREVVEGQEPPPPYTRVWRAPRRERE